MHTVACTQFDTGIFLQVQADRRCIGALQTEHTVSTCHGTQGKCIPAAEPTSACTDRSTASRKHIVVAAFMCTGRCGVRRSWGIVKLGWRSYGCVADGSCVVGWVRLASSSSSLQVTADLCWVGGHVCDLYACELCSGQQLSDLVNGRSSFGQ